MRVKRSAKIIQNHDGTKGFKEQRDVEVTAMEIERLNKDGWEVEL